MLYQAYRNTAVAILFLVLAGCATAPEEANRLSPKQETAKQFLHNIGVGELAMTAFRQEFEKTAADQPPGMVELAERVVADLKPEEFEVIVARVYARHLSHPHLKELQQYSEDSAISRFFHILFDKLAAGQPLDQSEIFRQFNADELTQLMKFSRSESFAAMRQTLPTINAEISAEGRKFGERKFQEYIEN